MNIKVIGLGGVGTYLCEALCRFLNYSSVETPQLTLVDGDAYEHKNLQRQVFTDFGNKAKIKSEDLKENYHKIYIEDVDSYVNAENVAQIVKNGDVVFVCVDNHKTRKVISDHAEGLDDVTIISGGNEFTDGNVQIYVRKGGVNLSPSLTDYHPEIATPGDRSPEDMGCEELAEAEPQLLFTNLSVATIMCWAFYTVVLNGKEPTSCAEIYFDIQTMSVRSQTRKPLVKGDRSNDESNIEREDSSRTAPNVSRPEHTWNEQEAQGHYH